MNNECLLLESFNCMYGRLGYQSGEEHYEKKLLMN